jgi:Domain of unknown function (DUF4149)
MAGMSFLRFLIVLSLIVWIGGLIFFPVVAQTAFTVLPSAHLGGLVVGRSLVILHWMGIFSGIIFLIGSMLYNRLNVGAVHVFATRHVLLEVMLALTLISQFSIIPRMDALRNSVGGDITSVALSNPAWVQFNALHVWSTRMEGGVLLLGLVVAYLTVSALRS